MCPVLVEMAHIVGQHLLRVAGFSNTNVMARTAS